MGVRPTSSPRSEEGAATTWPPGLLRGAGRDSCFLLPVTFFPGTVDTLALLSPSIERKGKDFRQLSLAQRTEYSGFDKIPHPARFLVAVPVQVWCTSSVVAGRHRNSQVSGDSHLGEKERFFKTVSLLLRYATVHQEFDDRLGFRGAVGNVAAFPNLSIVVKNIREDRVAC